MLDSGTKPPESRIHLFDPVGLLNDGYGYRASNYAVRPRRPTKSYDNFIDTNTTTGGLRSYDSFSDTNSVAEGLKSYDSFSSDTNGGGGLKSYDHTNSNSNKDINVGGGPKSYDHTNNKDINNGGGGLRFGVDTTMEDDSDVSTPRLWKPSSPTSPKSQSVNSSPLHPSAASPKSVKFTPPMSLNSSPVHPNHNHYHTISPNSRTQAIAKGRRELMEMVRDLPESFYELSLKDLVEQKPDMEVQKEVSLPEEKKPVAVVKETTKTKESKKQQKKSSKKVKKSESKKKMMRSRSVDNGKFLLRTSVFPIFMGSKKNKKNLGSSSSFKVAPVPKPPPTASRSMKGVEKDWWRRKSCISSESDESNGLSSNSASSSSSASTSRSNSSNGRRSNRFIPSCCFFNGRRIRGRK